jgi:hypothetical protein
MVHGRDQIEINGGRVDAYPRVSVRAPVQCMTNRERWRACRRMHKSEGAHAGIPWSDHPMARVDGVGGFRHRASAASGVSWGRTRS